MAKSKNKRVHNVAKDLGIESKDIIAKCAAEGIELKNHMATVSIGLEASIREWFSEEQSQSGSAIETSEHPDVSKIRKKARRRVKIEEPKEEPAPEPAPVVEETPVAQEPQEEPAPDATDEPKEPVSKAEENKARVEEELQKKLEAERAALKPAGPQLNQPTKAKVSGPKVIRVERPEEVRHPRPKKGGGGGPRSARQEQSDTAQAEADFIRSRGPQRGRGATTPGATDDRGRNPRRGGEEDRSKGGRGSSGQGSDSRSRKKWSAQDMYEREERLKGSGGYVKRRRRDMKNRGEGAQAQTPAQVGGTVEIEEPITIKGFSSVTGIKGADIVGFLFKKGIMSNINSSIETEDAMEIAMEYNIELEVKEAKTEEETLVAELEARDRADIRKRPPVVTVLGHVDHGKTSLLDRIRSSSIVKGEDGGITQHIGASRVTVTNSEDVEKTVVFLDTPGHEAFTEMRSRGANMTDIVVLVVAADDGVMPQTIESINHAKAAEVPIVVALNKIDLPQADETNVQKILGQLTEHGLNPTDWGGDTEVVKVSAETGQGIEELIDTLDYQAELLDLKAAYDGSGVGRIIEAKVMQGRGPVVSMLVQEGAINVGDFIVSGRAFGRVRDMIDDFGNRLTHAEPAMAIEISGLDELPDAGDRFYVTETLKQAENIAEQYREHERQHGLSEGTTMATIFDQIQAASAKELRVVIKADVQGSVEVLKRTLQEVQKENEEVTVKVLHSAVGGITQSDVILAEASDAIIVGFHVIASAKARKEAENRGVQVRLYRVIYDIVDDVKAALEGLLSPIQREEVLGHAEVREVFKVSKVGTIAGCYVTDGIVQRNALIRVTREDIVIEHDRELEQLKQFKDDAKDVRAGMECGMKIVGYDDIRQGDILECYVMKTEKATL